MSRALVIIARATDREKLHRWIDQAPWNTRVELKAPRRSLPQNDYLWKICTECSVQKDWHGVRLTPADWKRLFTAGLKRELRLVPNLTNDGFVQLGDSTSDMSKAELTDLIEYMLAWCAQNGVSVHRDEAEAA